LVEKIKEKKIVVENILANYNGLSSRTPRIAGGKSYSY
jgi:hypothetical protein